MKVFYKPSLQIGEISIAEKTIGNPLYRIDFEDGSTVHTYNPLDFEYVSR